MEHTGALSRDVRRRHLTGPGIRNTHTYIYTPPSLQKNGSGFSAWIWSRWLVYDPSSVNTAIRPLAEPDRISGIDVVLLDGSSASSSAAASPQPLVNRRRVEYFVPKMQGVRIFVEKTTAKQPIVSQMQADAGLSREGTLLGAVNEWRTWFVVDRRA